MDVKYNNYLTGLPRSYVSAARTGVKEAPVHVYEVPATMPVSGELCPFYAHGQCHYGDQCQYVHGDVCDMCQMPVLMPHDYDQQARHFQVMSDQCRHL